MLRLQVNFGKKDKFKYKELVELIEKIPPGAGIRNDYVKELMNYALKHGAPLPEGINDADTTPSPNSFKNSRLLSNELQDLV